MSKGKLKRLFVGIISTMILAIIAMISIFKPIEVVGNSMENKYSSGDVILINKLKKSIVVGDIVVFRYDGSILVKRVVGVNKDVVEIIDNKFYRNGQMIIDYDDFGSNKNMHCNLSENEYYVLGDNYNVSKDSRAFGAISGKDIMGVALQ